MKKPMRRKIKGYDDGGSVTPIPKRGLLRDITSDTRDKMLKTGNRDIVFPSSASRLYATDAEASRQAQTIDPRGEKGGFAKGGKVRKVASAKKGKR